MIENLNFLLNRIQFNSLLLFILKEVHIQYLSTYSYTNADTLAQTTILQTSAHLRTIVDALNCIGVRAYEDCSA